MSSSLEWNCILRLTDVIQGSTLPDTLQVSHVYADKFALAEYLTTAAISSILFVLEELGVTPKVLGQMKAWSHSRTVTIRLKARAILSIIIKLSPRQRSGVILSDT